MQSIMNMMTNKETSTITFQVRRTGEFGNHIEVTAQVYIPDLDIDDDPAKKVYHDAWSKYRSLPLDNPMFETFEEAKKLVRFHQMFLKLRPDAAYAVFVGECTGKESEVQYKLSRLNQLASSLIN